MAAKKSKKKVQKVETDLIFKALPKDWHCNGVDVEYEHSDCTENCHENGDYCRCTKIINERVTSIDYDDVYNYLVGKSEYEIKNYALHRLVNALTKDSFYVAICGGYYGEELDGVKLDDREFEKHFNFINSKKLNSTKLIEYMLNLEYGYVLDRLKDKKWNIKTININNIIQNDYKKNYSEIVEKYKNSEIELTVLCEQKSDNQFKLIDGYHRFAAAKGLGLKEIKVIYPYE